MAWAQCLLPLHIMQTLHPILASAGFFSPDHLLETFGTIGLVVVIFLESCFAPLPGDSLLFAAGLFASTGRYGTNVWVLCFSTFVAAVAGNQVAYWFGRKVGVALYNRDRSRLFSKQNLDKTHAYFERF